MEAEESQTGKPASAELLGMQARGTACRALPVPVPVPVMLGWMLLDYFHDSKDANWGSPRSNHKYSEKVPLTLQLSALSALQNPSSFIFLYFGTILRTTLWQIVQLSVCLWFLAWCRCSKSCGTSITLRDHIQTADWPGHPNVLGQNTPRVQVKSEVLRTNTQVQNPVVRFKFAERNCRIRLNVELVSQISTQQNNIDSDKTALLLNLDTVKHTIDGMFNR